MLLPVEKSAGCACLPSGLWVFSCVLVFSPSRSHVESKRELESQQRGFQLPWRWPLSPGAACLAWGPILFTFLERHRASWEKLTDRHRDQGRLEQKGFPTAGCQRESP